jgi:aminopeptidase N
MENISLVTWSDAFILDETNALERKHLTNLVNIHEMAHTYFGDLLVIRHFEHAWLKEGWATYMEPCWLQDNVSEDAFRYDMLENHSSYTKECEKYMVNNNMQQII